MMMRVLFVARYRDDTMHRKLELLAAEPDLEVRQICPRDWHDEHLRLRLPNGTFGGVRRTTLAMLGRPTDPHRAIYRTIDFGMRSFVPDIIHAEEEPESLAAVQLAVARRVFAPQAVLAFNTWQNLARQTKWHVRAVQRVALRASSAIFCANSEAAGLLRRAGYTRPAPVLPAIGVDTRVFKPGPQTTRSRPGMLVGYAGRLTAEKGLDTLIEALVLLAADSAAGKPPVTLRLIGNGSQRAALEAQAQAAHVGHLVQFLPSVPPTELAAAIQALDVLVLPSRTTQTWKEQFGRILTEAMACEVAVVGSNSGAIPEVIGGAGLVFPEGDAPALAGHLRRLRDAPAERQALARAGRHRVLAHYTQEHIAHTTAGYYRAWHREAATLHAHHA